MAEVEAETMATAADNTWGLRAGAIPIIFVFGLGGVMLPLLVKVRGL